MDVFNDDVAGIYRRINRYIEEAFKSASSNVADMNTFDQARLMSYLTDISTFLDWVVGQPQLDLPETHPKPTTLADPPTVPDIENSMIQDMVRLFERCRDECIQSQSARNATGLISFDEARIRAVIAKSSAYLTQYVQQVTPIDMPESMPAMEDTGHGHGGINP